MAKQARQGEAHARPLYGRSDQAGLLNSQNNRYRLLRTFTSGDVLLRISVSCHSDTR